MKTLISIRKIEIKKERLMQHNFDIFYAFSVVYRSRNCSGKKDQIPKLVSSRIVGNTQTYPTVCAYKELVCALSLPCPLINIDR